MTEVTPWPLFTDFAEGQGSAWLTDPRSKLNEFQKHSYVLDYFLPGKEPHMFLRSGANIKSHITLEEHRTYGPYDAGEPITYPETQTGAFATSHWTTARAPLAWNKREVLLQAEGVFDERSRAQTFHNVYWEKVANFMRSVGNAVDDEFFAYPTTTMESATGNVPRSLWVFFNEARHTDDESLGAATDWNGTTTPASNGLWPGFTTIAGIDPTDYLIGSSATQSRWAVQQKTYSQLHNASTEGFRVMGGGDLIYQFDSMLLDLKWQAVPRAEQYSFTNGDKVIFTTRQGVQAIRQSLVSTSNDRWMGMAPNQTGVSMMYDGKSVVRMSGMETAYVYPTYDGATEGDQAAANTAAGMANEGGFVVAGTAAANAHTGPRFMFVDTSDLVCFFHPEAFFTKSETRTLFESRPDTFAMFLENWRNMHPKRLRSSGFLYPSVDIVGVSYTS
jgi:hypothetical protein